MQARKVKLDEKGNNEKLNLTFRMMLGVRVAVGRMANPFLKLDDLNQHDFAQASRPSLKFCPLFFCLASSTSTSRPFSGQETSPEPDSEYRVPAAIQFSKINGDLRDVCF